MNEGLNDQPVLMVEGLEVSYRSFKVLKNLSFSVNSGSCLTVMGSSGCGKSTLMKALIGLIKPSKGLIKYAEADLWNDRNQMNEQLLSNFGVLFQGSALWSSMTIFENVALPLETFTNLSAKEIREVVNYKLSLVGLYGLDDRYPSELSGGMQKRAGLARALAMDPKILFLDEPSAGLDPVNSRSLDELIIQLKQTLGVTFLVISHDIESIYSISDEAIFMSDKIKGIVARGNPRNWRIDCEHSEISNFLSGKKGNDLSNQ